MTVKLKLDLSPAAGIRSFAVGLGLSIRLDRVCAHSAVLALVLVAGI